MLTRTRQKAKREGSKEVQAAQEPERTPGEAAPGLFLGTLYGGAYPSKLFQFRWNEIAGLISRDIQRIRDTAIRNAAAAPDRSKWLAVQAVDAQCPFDDACKLVEIAVMPKLEWLDDVLGSAVEAMIQLNEEKESRSQTAPASPVKATQ